MIAETPLEGEPEEWPLPSATPILEEGSLQDRRMSFFAVPSEDFQSRDSSYEQRTSFYDAFCEDVQPREGSFERTSFYALPSEDVQTRYSLHERRASSYANSSEDIRTREENIEGVRGPFWTLPGNQRLSRVLTEKSIEKLLC